MGIEIGEGNNLTAKEFIELRLKCLELFVSIGSKHGIEKEEVLRYAENAWNGFVVKPLVEQQKETPPPEPLIVEPGAKKTKPKAKS